MQRYSKSQLQFKDSNNIAIFAVIIKRTVFIRKNCQIYQLYEVISQFLPSVYKM